jgi:hypothetical protein
LRDKMIYAPFIPTADLRPVKCHIQPKGYARLCPKVVDNS